MVPPFRCTEFDDSPFDPARVVELSPATRALYSTLRLLLAAARKGTYRYAICDRWNAARHRWGRLVGLLAAPHDAAATAAGGFACAPASKSAPGARSRALFRRLSEPPSQLAASSLVALMRVEWSPRAAVWGAEYSNDPNAELAAARQEAHRNIPGGCV